MQYCLAFPVVRQLRFKIQNLLDSYVKHTPLEINAAFGDANQPATPKDHYSLSAKPTNISSCILFFFLGKLEMTAQPSKAIPEPRRTFYKVAQRHILSREREAHSPRSPGDDSRAAGSGPSGRRSSET